MVGAEAQENEMKRQIAIVACLVLFHQPLIAWAIERYAFVAENVDGKFFLDMGTISYSHSQGTYRFWCKLVPSEAFLEELKSGEMPKTSHVLTLYEINTSMRMTKTVSVTIYAANGRVIKTKTFNMDWEPIIPNSISESFLDAVLYVAKEAPELIKKVK